ncbi:hypothetical protein O2K51_08235 [Apibacter raozihei]|uniref:hypothetical protein n=1 Tax=Apibacter TaxID=1778601 RepID=UPI000FE352FA|nr:MULTISPECIES: hypothetical protein [Apibacter]
MGDFYLVKASFIYLEFQASIEREIPVKLQDRERHLQILSELEEILSVYLQNFKFSEFYEMPFLDTEGKDNGYFIRKLASHKESGLKGKLELMVKRLD